MPLQSLWAATAPEGPACSALAGPHRAQAIVIGAGYTGLSAALHLAKRAATSSCSRRGEIGERASGVNGGQVIPGVKLDPDNLEALLGPYAGGRLVATAAAGPDLVFDTHQPPRHSSAMHCAPAGSSRRPPMRSLRSWRGGPSSGGGAVPRSSCCRAARRCS